MTAQWAAAFTSDGKYLVYSTALPPLPPATTEVPETLYSIATDAIGTTAPTLVGPSGISKWDISPDGAHVFYMRDFNYSDTSPSGTLHMADFPSGANERRLAGLLLGSGGAGGVAGYKLVSTVEGKGLAFVAIIQKFVAQTGEYRILKEPAGNLEDPNNVRKVLDNLPAFPVNSPDLRYGWYFETRSQNYSGITDSWLLRNDGTGSCALSMNPTSAGGWGPLFAPDSSLVLWVDNYDRDTDSADGMLASPGDCTTGKRKFASRIDWWVMAGDRLLYADDVVDTRSTLRVATIGGGQLGAATVIQVGSDRAARTLPDLEAVLFRIDGSSADIDGIYMRKLR